MNISNILQADPQDKAPTTDYPREPELYNSVRPNLTQELEELQEVRETLLALPCSQKVEPIVAQLSEILNLAHDGGGIDVDRLRILVHTARAKG